MSSPILKCGHQIQSQLIQFKFFVCVCWQKLLLFLVSGRGKNTLHVNLIFFKAVYSLA